MDHTSAEVQESFLEAHRTWGTGQFEAFMNFMDENVLYIVNIDGQQVPYAMSALGREDVRFRFLLLLQTFDIEKFEVLALFPEPQHITSLVHGIYRHKATGEILDVKVRFRGWATNRGTFERLEEIHDARYVEAFERFAFFLQNTASTT
ncbi:MAG: hypothetical protein ACOYLQ_15265 [Hyphomicrobiaceae bacterium]|jgi:hypothetical protein